MFNSFRYSKKKETETELLLYFCRKLKDFKPSISRTCALPSGETDLNSMKCLTRRSFTSGLSKLPSIDFNMCNDFN